jgi:fibronectin-binding autotransporter adhesin
MSYASRALALASALLMGAPAALAHTNSIGYVGNGTGGVTFWYGSWHGGTTFNEGELKLEGANGTTFNPTITQFTIINNATPNGLVPGTNYFQSDGTALVGYQSSPGVGNGESYTWQGVTFNSLAAGDYTFTYIPLGNAESYQPNVVIGFLL